MLTIVSHSFPKQWMRQCIPRRFMSKEIAVKSESKKKIKSLASKKSSKLSLTPEEQKKKEMREGLHYSSMFESGPGPLAQFEKKDKVVMEEKRLPKLFKAGSPVKIEPVDIHNAKEVLKTADALHGILKPVQREFTEEEMEARFAMEEKKMMDQVKEAIRESLGGRAVSKISEWVEITKRTENRKSPPGSKHSGSSSGGGDDIDEELDRIIGSVSSKKPRDPSNWRSLPEEGEVDISDMDEPNSSGGGPRSDPLRDIFSSSSGKTMPSSSSSKRSAMDSLFGEERKGPMTMDELREMMPSTTYELKYKDDSANSVINRHQSTFSQMFGFKPEGEEGNHDFRLEAIEEEDENDSLPAGSRKSKKKKIKKSTKKSKLDPFAMNGEDVFASMFKEGEMFGGNDEETEAFDFSKFIPKPSLLKKKSKKQKKQIESEFSKQMKKEDEEMMQQMMKDLKRPNAQKLENLQVSRSVWDDNLQSRAEQQAYYDSFDQDKVSNAEMPEVVATFVGKIQDSRGNSDLTVESTGHSLNMKCRGIRFESTDMVKWTVKDAYMAQEVAVKKFTFRLPEHASVEGGGIGISGKLPVLTSCVLDFTTPTKIIIRPPKTGGIASSSSCSSSSPATSNEVVQEAKIRFMVRIEDKWSSFSISLEMGGATLKPSDTSGISELGFPQSFKDQMDEIKKQLPPNCYVKNCWGCALGEFSPLGKKTFGSLSCFKDYPDFHRIRSNVDLLKSWEHGSKTFHETHVCESWKPREKEAIPILKTTPITNPVGIEMRKTLQAMSLKESSP